MRCGPLENGLALSHAKYELQHHIRGQVLQCQTFRKCTNGIFDGPRRISKRVLMEEVRFVVRSECCVRVVRLVRRTDCYRGTCDKKKRHVPHVQMVFEMVRRRMWTAVRKSPKCTWVPRILLSQCRQSFSRSCTGTMGKSVNTTNVSRTMCGESLREL